MSPTITNPKHKYTSIYCISPSSTFDYRLYLNNFHSYFIIIRDTSRYHWEILYTMRTKIISRDIKTFTDLFFMHKYLLVSLWILKFSYWTKMYGSSYFWKKWWSQLDVTSFWEATSFKINKILHHKSPCCVCGIYRQSKYIYRCQCNVTSILNIWNHGFMRSFLLN